MAPPGGLEEAAPQPAPPAAPIDLRQYGPAIQAVLERERTTPGEWLEGILLLVELGEPELARPLLDNLVQADLDATAQAELTRRFGTHRLLRLARADALGDAARSLAVSLMDAHAALVRSRERLSQLIRELGDAEVHRRYAAVAGLIEAGEAAAVALVAALDDVEAAAHRQWLHVALAELSPSSRGPLLAGLEAPSASTRAQSAEVLGRVAPPHLAVRLMGPALVDQDPQVRTAASNAVRRIAGGPPSAVRAEHLLREAVDQHLQAKLPLDTDENGEVEVWRWDDVDQAPAALKLPPRQAHVQLAARLAEDLVALAPDNAEYREQSLMLHLAADPTRPRMRDWLASVDVEEARRLVLGAMEEALRRDLPHAIIGAARVLGELPGEDALTSHAPAESPLVRALAHPNRSVQWHALAAIMRIDPQRPYPGASRVAKSLVSFIEAGARPRAVVAMTTLERARSLSAAVDRLGYDAALATTGREAVLTAAGRGGADVVLVDARISRPPLREVLYQLRAHPHSAGAAIGVLGIGGGLASARDVAEDHPGVQAFPHPLVVVNGADAALGDAPPSPLPLDVLDESAAGAVVVDEEAVAVIVDRLLPADQQVELGTPSRKAMSRQALTWLGQLLARDEAFYDVRQYAPTILSAADDADLLDVAVGLLALIGSHESQLRLLSVVNVQSLPIELREAAAESFRASVARYGVQLTKAEILQQYDRYNASETADRPTQVVLGHVLDTIEAGKR